MTGSYRAMIDGRMLIAALLAASLGAAAPARATEAPYDASMARLAEVLGSLHFLRNLCGEKGTQWRDRMEKLLASENPSPEQRSRLVAGFNRGYRTFNASYTTCTPSATAAIDRYMKEGEELSRDIASRFGN